MVDYGTDVKLNFDTPDVSLGINNDFELVSASDNLIQAIKTRLLTKKGTLETHILFGSDLYKLIGQNIDEVALNSAGAYIHQALSEETRVKEINSINIDYRIVDGKNTLVIFLEITPIDSDELLNLVVSYEV